MDLGLIKGELERATKEYEKLQQSIKDARRDLEKVTTKKKAAEYDQQKAEVSLKELQHDLSKAQEVVTKQQRDLDGVLHEHERISTQLSEYVRKEGDYKNKVTELERQLRKISP